MTTQAENRTGAAARRASWYEASARNRIRGLLDPDSFEEFIGPEQREVSPHLALFDLPAQFDDGMIVGRGSLNGEPVLIAAQEGRFMGGAVGEVHGAKLTGLLRAAKELKNRPVLILFDSGGVRLQEANAGELAIAEIMRAMVEARLAGVNVVGVVGGRAGCYGGAGLISACCSALIVSEQGRIGVTGPEVIETNHGIEEFDSRDRAMTWRTMGGKQRRLTGSVEAFADDTIDSFRGGVIRLLAVIPAFSLTSLKNAQARLADRLQRFGTATDATDIWRRLGINTPEAVPTMPAQDFVTLADRIWEPRYDAR